MDMRYRFIVVSLLCAALPLLAEKFHLNPTPAVPSANGDVNIDRDGNGNTRVELHVDHLARPADLTPAMSTYVVWFQVPGMPPENEGELKVGGDLKASLRTVTPDRNFDIIITAEQNPQTRSMTGPEVMRATIHQR